MGIISVLADMSAVLVILEFMLLAVIPLAVLYLAIRGMHWLNEHLRLGLQQVQGGVNRVRDAVNQGAQSVARPFVAASVYAAQVQGFLNGVGQALRGKSSERFKEVQ